MSKEKEIMNWARKKYPGWRGKTWGVAGILGYWQVNLVMAFLRPIVWFIERER